MNYTAQQFAEKKSNLGSVFGNMGCEDTMDLFAEMSDSAQTGQSSTMRAICDAMDTSAFAAKEDGSHALSGGDGRTWVYTVFNSASLPRKDIAVLTLWDYGDGSKKLSVTDERGTHLPFELVEKEPVGDSNHTLAHLNVLVTVPAMGWTTVVVKETSLRHSFMVDSDGAQAQKQRSNVVLENIHLRAEFDARSGALLSLTDKETGIEQLDGPAGLFVVLAERKTNSMRRVSRHFKAIPVENTISLRTNGLKLCPGFEMEQKIFSSRIRTCVTLEGDARELHYTFDVDWNEASGNGDTVPVLAFRAPVAESAEELLCDIPVGSVVHHPQPVDHKCKAFAAALGEGFAPALMSDAECGCRLDDHVLSCTLINFSEAPGSYQARDLHNIHLWLSSSNGNPVVLQRRAEALANPLTVMPAGAHRGNLPTEVSLLSVKSSSSMLFGVETDQEGGILVRVYEMQGRADHVTLELPFAPKSADCGVIRDHTVCFDIAPYGLAEVRIS